MNLKMATMCVGYFVLILVVCGASAAVPQCRDDEMLCYDQRKCIASLHWCDDVPDCFDYSDEDYCDGASNASSTNSYLPPRFDVNVIDKLDTADPLVRAARYILNQRNPYGNWGSFTPRAVIALAFAGRASVISKQEKQLLQKQLNVDLLFNLMQNRTEMRDSTLALYINALHATCQDPRKFEGMDLVARLRVNVEAAKKKNSILPLPMLTLCLADDTMDRRTLQGDGDQLVKMFNEGTVQAMQGSSALTAMAMICYSRKDRRDYTPYLNSIFRKNNSTSNMDIYNKALFMQALIARGETIVPEELTRAQRSDGSFGDLLSTYYSIPVLMKSSLLDLKCPSYTTAGKRFGSLMMAENAENRVILSIWLSGFSKDVRSQSLTLSFDGSRSLQEVMLMAAERDPLYRFAFSETGKGNIVYKFANVPNDIESRRSWKLYSGTIGRVTLGSDQNLQNVTFGIDRVEATNGTNFVFWNRRA